MARRGAGRLVLVWTEVVNRFIPLFLICCRCYCCYCCQVLEAMLEKAGCHLWPVANVKWWGGLRITI